MAKKGFNVAVELSRRWDGSEVAEEIIKKFNERNIKPKLILLFTTIHYEKEFEKLLSGIKKVFSDVPLIGGTVAGFMTKDGCFTRGVTSVAFDIPDSDISIGIGNNTKRNPGNAAKNSAEMAKKSCNKKPDFYFEFISGPIIPTFPVIGKQTVVKTTSMGSMLEKALPALWKSNMGTDRADEFLENVTKYIDSPLIGAVCMDDGKLMKCYQFYNEKIFKNSAILIGISSGIKPEFETVSALVPRGKKISFSIKKNMRTVTKINDRPATAELCKILGWKIEDIREVEKFYSQAFYYPFGYYKNDVVHAGMLGLILGKNIYFANKIESNELELFGLTGNKIISECQRIFSKKSNFVYGVICETYIETLGKNIYKIHEIINEFTEEFLLLFAGGESIVYEDLVPHHLYESINILRI